MSMTFGKLDLNEYLKSQIMDFGDHVKNYQKSLNNEGIWLFLAALGCWSVPHKSLQSVAFIISLVVFGYRMYLQVEDSRPFKKIYADIKEQVESSDLDADIKKARLYDLDRIVRKELSLIKRIKSMLIFIICFFFTVVSMELAKTL